MPEVASDCCAAATKRYMFRRVGASNDDVRTTRESDKLPDLSVKYLTDALSNSLCNECHIGGDVCPCKSCRWNSESLENEIADIVDH